MADLAVRPPTATPPADMFGATPKPPVPAPTTRPPGPKPLADGSTDPTAPAARQAQAEMGSVMAEGAGAAPAPIKGTEADSIQNARSRYEGMDEAAKKAEVEKLKQQSALFSGDKMKAATKDLSPEEAAEQRTRNARELIIQAKALGVDPATLGMDTTVMKAVETQQKMVDDLANKSAGLPPGAQQAAAMAARMREENKGKPQTKEQRAAYEELLKKNGLTREALDKLPPEQRLLIAGFNPDEIADHFTARDKDADVIQDKNNPGNNTAKRGETGGPQAGGDKNVDGTVRRPMTTAEADRAIDINAVLDESWHAAGSDGTPATRFGKLVDQGVVAGQMKTGGRNPALYGDVGEVGNTERSPSGAGKATGTDQVQATGLDYNTSTYVGPDGKTPSDFVKNDKVHRVEGDVTQTVADTAEVCLGSGVYARAQQRAAELEAQKATAYVPKMLRTDARVDPGDNLPGIMKRTRGDAESNMVDKIGPDGKPVIDPATGAPVKEAHQEIDPKSGLGYSVTERANMPVVPNQERKMRTGVELSQIPGAEISRSDTHEGMLVLDPTTNRMVPKSTLSPEQQAYYAALKADPNGDVAQGRTPPTTGGTP